MLEDKKIMLPPRLACPKIERFSIGWRMGYGEDYKILAGRKINCCMFWKTHPDIDGSIGKGCFSQWQHIPFYSAAS